jgi:hypothetical protein
MNNDKPGWEDEEETIVSFGETPVAQGSPSPAPRDDDPEATIVDLPEPDSETDSEDRTVVEGGTGRPRKVGDIAWLVLTKTQSVRRGDMFKLNQVRNDIGSGPVDISINDRKASKSHATIKYESAGGGAFQFVLHDLASTNGTSVNGQRLTAPVALKDGDRIGIGDTELVFKRV